MGDIRFDIQVFEILPVRKITQYNLLYKQL